MATRLARAGEPEAAAAFRVFVAAKESAAWVRSLSIYCLGPGDEEALLLAANRGKDAKTVGYQLAEAYFFMGIQRLVAGNRAGMKDCFDQSSKANAKRYGFEIRALLAQMDGGKL